MNDDSNRFNSLVKLHNEIKKFKLERTPEIFDNFYQNGNYCFKKYINEANEEEKYYLSCSAICSYALFQYCNVWDSGKIRYRDEYKDRDSFFSYLVDPNKWATKDPIKKPDEFTTINTLYLIKKINGERGGKIKKKNEESESINEELLEIIRELCKRFIYDEFAIFEKPHPFIYYKFYRLLTVWINDISKDLVNDHKSNFQEWGKTVSTDFNKKKYHNKFIEFSNCIFRRYDEKDSEKICAMILDYFFDKIYHEAKYEMYRQISLYHAGDKALFDVKRLIYGLLIVKERDRYSNNIIYNKVLEIVFDEQHETGLFPIGHVINNDFVIEKSRNNYNIKPALISTKPIISSIECLNDLLDHVYIKDKLGAKYEPNFRKAYEWVMGSLKRGPDLLTDPCPNQDSESQRMGTKDRNHVPCNSSQTIPNNLNRRYLQGWNPEYESTHVAESWVAGYCLLFLKNYCDMLSMLIAKEVKSDLQAVSAGALKEKWNSLLDSYNVKGYIEYMLNDDNCRSALLFGPPGVGKSTLAKALSNELGWDYVEITPGRFLDEGDHNIIKNINIIFEKLYQLKNTIIFFDEVDQLVKTRQSDSESGDVWVVTALLPKLQELHGNKKIKFVLATNHIDRVDSAIKRPGRIDLVIPMGGICWPDRLRFLIKHINDKKGELYRLERELFGSNFNAICDLLDSLSELKNEKDQSTRDKREEEILQNIKNAISSQKFLKQLLSNTNNMPYENIKYIFQELMEESSNPQAARNIYKKYVVPEPTKKGGEVEKFDDFFRREEPKNCDPLPPIPYSEIMRMPNKVEKLIKDNDTARFIYIRKHILDFCTFHE